MSQLRLIHTILLESQSLVSFFYNFSVTQSKRAGVIFPVGRIKRTLREGRYAKLIGRGAPVYMAAVFQYLVEEVLISAGDLARDHKRRRINPRHITLTVRNDVELDGLWKNVTISEGGVLPFIHQELKKRKSTRTSSQKTSQKNSQKASQTGSQKASQMGSQEARKESDEF